VGRYCSASPAWRFEQGGDLSDGFGAWADVSHRGARVAVPGLGHDQLQGDGLLAEVGGRGVAELVQLPPGVPVGCQKSAYPVICSDDQRQP
jgi:hypothetical protein